MIEDRIRRAIDAHEPELRADGPPPWADIEAAAAAQARSARRRRWIASGALAAAVLVVVGLVAVVMRDDPDSVGVLVDTPSTTTTEAPTTTTALSTTTTTAMPAFPDPGAVGGIYPDQSAYRRNGASAYDNGTKTATAFAKEYLGMKAPVVRQAGSSSWTVRPNSRASVTTTLILARVGPGGPWTVTDARTPGIVVRSPFAGMTAASPLALSGSAHAFEGHVAVEVRSEGMRAGSSLGDTFVTGGGDALRPFSGKVEFRLPGGVVRGAVVFLEPSAEDGSPLAATVVRVEFGSSSSPPSLNDASELRLDGVGPIVFGMTVAEAKAAARTSLKQTSLPECTVLTPKTSPAGLDLMAPKPEGRVRYAVVKSGPVKTEEGIGIGSDEAAVKNAYPDAEAREQRFVRFGAETVMVFHMEGGKVVSMWSGPREMADTYEVCT